MSLDQLIRESGAQAVLSNEGICDIKNLTKVFLRMASKRGCSDLVSEEYCFKIATGIFGNWEWQCKQIREGKQRGTLEKKVTDSLWRP